MNREYHDGTEPDTLPHFTHCSGPCNQGRLPCPCPMACEIDALEADISVVALLVRLVVIALAFVGLGAIVGRFV
jgi:hypothetical protein